MREFRRYLSGFVLYTNNPSEIDLLKKKKKLFHPLCVYTAAEGQKCIGAEFLFKLPVDAPHTLVYARRYIESKLKEWE